MMELERQRCYYGGREGSVAKKSTIIALFKCREIDDNYDHYVREEGGKLSTQRYSPKV